MNILSNDYTKISNSGYLVGDNTEAEFQGEISLYDDYIRFENIEFDSRIILYWNICIFAKDNK